METKVSRKDILEANRQGIKDNETGDFGGYYTPVLQVAYNYGLNGNDLTEAPVVTGFRYGKAPETYISKNYADDRMEKGLSLAALDGDEEVGSTIWFCDRKVYHYTGILCPATGSDGEPLILCLEAENWDN